MHPSRTDLWLSRLCALVLIALPLLMVYGHIRRPARSGTTRRARPSIPSPTTSATMPTAAQPGGRWSHASTASLSSSAGFRGGRRDDGVRSRRGSLSWPRRSPCSNSTRWRSIRCAHPNSPSAGCRLQAELDKGPVDKAKDRAWRIALEVAGHRPPAGVPVSSYVANHQNDRLHLAGIQPVRYLLPLRL